MISKSPIKYCPFCGHWINDLAEKCSNCGEFLDIKSKRSLWHLIPNWISILATVVIAGAAVIGAIKVKDILLRERAKAIENYLTWIEVTPIDLLSTGKKDPKDQSSTFWYIKIQAKNLGKKTAYVHLRDWSIESNKRGKILRTDYKPEELKFSVLPGIKADWLISFVMNSDYHIPPLMTGEDVLTIKFQLISNDMADEERCTYEATWSYTKGEFSLVEDNRRYSIIKIPSK